MKKIKKLLKKKKENSGYHEMNLDNSLTNEQIFGMIHTIHNGDSEESDKCKEFLKQKVDTAWAIEELASKYFSHTDQEEWGELTELMNSILSRDVSGERIADIVFQMDHDEQQKVCSYITHRINEHLN